MTVPGLPSWALPDRPAAAPPGGFPDPPLTQRLPGGDLLVFPMASPELWGGGFNVPGGWDDSTQINAAAQEAGGAAANGGRVLLGPWQYQCHSQIVLPQQSALGNAGAGPVSLLGIPGSTRLVHGPGFAGSLVYMHRTSGYGAQYGLPAQSPTGAIRDLIIDGSQAPAGAAGLDIGDGWGLDADLEVVNYTSGIGIWHINRVFWSEKNRIRAHLKNNLQGLVVDTTNAGGAMRSHEYNIYDLDFFCNNSVDGAGGAQSGITIQNGAFVAGSSWRVKGNFEDANAGHTPATMWVITGQDGSGNFSTVNHCFIDLVVEANNGRAVGVIPFTFGGPNNFLGGSSGQIQLQFSSWGVTNPATGQFQFEGPMSGDTSLFAVNQPAVPASGTPFVNNQNSSMVYVTGGTVTEIDVANINTGRTSGGFFVPMNRSITLTYSAAPTWVWVAAH